MTHCIIRGVTGYNFQKKNVFLILEIEFVFVNSADPDEMPQYLGLHCLLKYTFRSH